MSLLPANLMALVESRRNGALATIKRDGRPQLSMVSFAWYPQESLVRVSTVEGTAKVANLRRDSRTSLLVTGTEGWSYAVLEGYAELSPVSREPDDAVVNELVDVYREVSGGEHPDWDDYRRAMVDDHRLVLRLHVERGYGLHQG